VLRIPVQGGQPYVVAVDTPRGVEARMRVNWGLGVAPVFTGATVQWSGASGGALELEAGMVPGTGQSSYQWRLMGQAIAGATNAVYSVGSVTAADAGRYELVVSNWFGMVTNVVAEVEVTEPMRLEAQVGAVGGVWQLRVLGTGSTGVVLEASKDLRGWEPVWTNSVSTGAWEYVEPVPAIQGQRFYRARPWP
jgi:hypothetical protein